MARRVEKLVPVPDISMVEGLERRAGGKYQVERDFWDLSSIRLFNVSNRRIGIIIWRAGRRPAFF